MRKAMSLIEENGFEKADVAFITDGECELNEAYAQELCEKQTALGFTVTGILLDANSPGMDFSLKTFFSSKILDSLYIHAFVLGMSKKYLTTTFRCAILKAYAGAARVGSILYRKE